MSKKAVLWTAVSSQRQAKDDKISLPYQEEQARAWCAANGYEVIEVLRVEGHSRSDPNLIRLLEAYEKKGVTAYARLQELWAIPKSFDVLVAFSSDRLGRSGALIHWVIETCYYEGRQVCLTDGGGLLDPQNYRMQALLGTAQATMPMDSFREKTRVSKQKLDEEGLITTSWPTSHKPVRDPITGKVTGVVVNEERRPLYELIAQLLIERLSWADVGVEMAKRGILTEEGMIYSGGALRAMMLNGWLFGHNIRHHTGPARKRPRGRWLFDAEFAPPDGVEVYRDTIPAMFDAANPLTEPLKAEMRNRFLIKGRGSSQEAHRFSRLLVCDECGWLISVHTRRYRGTTQRWGYLCGHSRSNVPPDRRCSQNKSINNKTIQAFVQAQLERYLRTGTIAAINTPPQVSEAERLKGDIDRLNGQIDRLIEEQSYAPENLRARYRTRIEEAGKELAQRDAAWQRVRAQEASAQRMREDQRQSGETIRTMGEALWTMPDPMINQILLRFFGDWCFAVRDGRIVRLTERTSKA